MSLSAENALIETATPSWQCILICWGTRYGTDLINNLVDAIGRHAASLPRFVLITDGDKPGLSPEVQTVRFPDYWLQPAMKTSGCQAKLVMFEKGILKEDLPAVYVDLDTIVFGNLQRMLELLATPQTVALLQSAVLPFGPLGRFVHRFTRGKNYARGNSSFVVFHPAHNHYIAERFRTLYAAHPDFSFRPMIADERFISWVAQEHARAVPADFAAKFPGEYMSRYAPWLYFKALLPWVRSRRERQLAITLNGLSIKPEILVHLKTNERVTDQKQRVLIWSPQTLGTRFEKIKSFYAFMH